MDIEIIFNPIDTGLRNAQLLFRGDCAEEAILGLSGTGICSGESVKKIDMGQVDPGSTKDSTIICAFRNICSWDMEVSPIITGSNSSDFDISPSGALLIGANDCQDFTISFSPGAVGERSAKIEFIDDIFSDLAGKSEPNSVAGDNAGTAFLALEALEPNPASGETNVVFTTARSGQTTIKIHSILGVQIFTAFDKYVDPGSYSVNLPLNGTPAGVYLITLKSGAFSDTKKLIISK